MCRWTLLDGFFSVLVNDDPLVLDMTTVTGSCSGRSAYICHTPPKTSKPPQSDPTQWNAHLWSQTYAAHCLVNTLNIVASLITMTLRVNWFYPVRKLIWILAYLVAYSQLLQGARKLFSILYTINLYVTRDHKSINQSVRPSVRPTAHPRHNPANCLFGFIFG